MVASAISRIVFILSNISKSASWAGAPADATWPGTPPSARLKRDHPNWQPKVFGFVISWSGTFPRMFNLFAHGFQLRESAAGHTTGFRSCEQDGSNHGS